MSLTFEEAATGVSTKIRVPRLEVCEICKGTGAKPGTGMSVCQQCGGRGQLHYQQGFFAISRTCAACRGTGQVIRDVCQNCRGQGQIEREHTIELRIPAGVDTGTRLRIAGEGEPGVNSGPPGDLYVVLEVKDHAIFERRNADLFCTIPITVAQGALGDKIAVPTLNGEEQLALPEGTQSGQIFRLKGKGLPNPHGGKGDLYVNVQVITPSKLTREQRRLFEQLREILKVDNKPAARTSSFLDKVKDIFG
jgi:molecular chaperone DnaJ